MKGKSIGWQAEDVIAAISAQQPGTGSTLMLLSLACLMNL